MEVKIRHNNYTVYHLHDDYSNCNGFADSCSKFEEYIKLAKQQNMTAIAFSNHGGIYDWIKKKQVCDKSGIKYIHGVELYLCKSFEDADRGCHIGLYSKNFDGVLELNNLLSKATSKGVEADNSDRHMYFNYRISLEELMNTSDNIIFTSACLASPLNKWNTKYDKELGKALQTLISWMQLNKHRCFLEIQYHNCESQIRYNKWLHKISKRKDIPLIAGTDTHSSSNYKSECRKILQIAKDNYYGEEDEFDLTWKTYDELIECFKAQAALDEDIYMQAIDNTNIFADMIEEFTLDKCFKYPNLYGDDVRNQWRHLINNNFTYKLKCGILDKNKISIYKTKIAEEFKVMCKLGMESFMMFMSELLSWCSDNDIPYGTGRGSVCGSVIAYITNITDVDPVKWNTVFSRFCNEDRISLGDIDVDFAPEDRVKVFEYIIDRFTPQKTAYIAAFSTLKDRGCIDVLAKGLKYSNLDKVMDIKNMFESFYKSYEKIVQEEVNMEDLVEEGLIDSFSIDFDNHDIYISRINNENLKLKACNIKKDYDELIRNNSDLFYYLDGLKGTIIAKGVHPSGIIGSPITLSDNIGVMYKGGDENIPVSVCAMKSVDSLNYVKFDILGLKTVGIIKEACEYAGLKYPKSYEVNWSDENVWNNMIQSKQGVFQFEGDYAHNLLSDFKPKTINHMSMVNAALRPSGKSYRDRLIAGDFNINPSKEIDDLLSENNGFLIFQEDTIKFLTDICDFSGSAADTTRRAIGKKDSELLKQQLPKILEGYCKHSSQSRDIAEQEAKQFIQIIQDSSEYQFGYNHSTAYSMNGYECVYLRTYYPLEFITAYLNRAENKDDTNNGIDLAKQYNIEIKPIQFGKSKAQYTFDKDNNCIYKGIHSIKYCNEKIANELYSLANRQSFNNFLDLILAIKQDTSVDSRQLKILTTLNFFNDFGSNKKLLQIIDFYDDFIVRKTIKKSDIEKLNINMDVFKYCFKTETEKTYKDLDMKKYVMSITKYICDKPLSVKEQIKHELEYLEYIIYTNSKAPKNMYYVTELKTYKDKTKPYLILYNIRTGYTIKTKITQGKKFVENPFKQGSIINISKFDEKQKTKMINGKWQKTGETEKIISEWDVY